MESIGAITDLGITISNRVLVFMPHPDDEAVFISGLLQKIAKNNPNLKIITITAGEKSTLRFGISPEEDLATIRKNELNHALSTLGVSDHETWNFPDGGIEKQCTAIQAKVQKEIIHYQPTHIITLEPDGIYGHPDHIALSKIVTQASPPPIKLLYATVTPNYHFPSARSMATKSSIQPLQPQFKMRLTPKETVNKMRALWAHKSQFQSAARLPKTVFALLINDMLFHEYFTYKK